MKRIYLLLITTVLFTACQQKAEHAAHEAENIKLSLTDLNGQVEIFAEYDPFIKDSASKFAIHLTTLEDYKPIKRAKVTTSLVIGSTGIRKVLDSATVPGIYKIVLNPKIQGKGELIFDINLNGNKHQFKVSATVFASYDEFKKQHQSPAASANEITFLKEQSWKLDFGVTKIGTGSFAGVIKAPATITAAVGDQESIVATAAGVLKFRAPLTTGSKVSSGQTLFSISGASLTGDNLNTEVQEAKLNLAKAKADYERAKTLRPDQIISEKDYQNAFNNYQQQQLNYQKLSRNFSGNGVSLKSQTSGFLTDLLVKEGDYVQAGQQLAIVSASKKIQLTADVPAAYAGQLSQVKSANFRINDKLYELENLNGKLLSYGRSVSASGLILVIFSLDNRPEFLPGVPVEAYLLTSSGSSVLQIPEAAIMEDQGNYFVYVQKDGEHFERRGIQLGQSNGKMVQVTQGVQDGDILVTKGAYYLKLAAGQGSAPAHGHEH
ncbi:efflux RND transporter periplasmic adaptor subunit [Pedobacter gandavensis]|uniref:efflux RND transporter periplasmic adaptor subunit n=1 Tax=Pedobacter gandavensis TaxID=2679963 RepID=UPI0029300B7A|nr:efflux RND transporter periplasmic adaptor subunit [Pedobacter gandavensis]